jgi:hypothetical protein
MKASPPTFQSRGQADVDATALPTARGYRVGRVGEVRIPQDMVAIESACGSGRLTSTANVLEGS